MVVSHLENDFFIFLQIYVDGDFEKFEKNQKINLSS